MARTPTTRWLALLVLPALLVTAPVLYLAALAAAEPLFRLGTPVGSVDVIVVLGGDGPARAAKASAVYHSIADASKPQVLITGDGDCLHIARMMAEREVPAERITTECESGNTWENAQFSKPLLAEMGARSALLVTSWFHVRRALGCFASLSPQIAWGAAPVERHRSIWEIAWDIEGREAAKEYLKVAWYALRHGLLVSFVEPVGDRSEA